MAEGCATLRLFLERTLARLPPTLGGVYSAAMISCDKLPIRCEKHSVEGTLSVALVFCFRGRSCYSARQVVAMFNRRFDLRPIEERLSVCYVPIPHRRSAANAAQPSTDASSSQAPQPTSMQQSQLSSSSAGFRPLIPISSPHSATPGSASVVFGAPFSSGAPLSFVSPTGTHASSDSSRSRTAQPASNLFAQPAFNVTITPMSAAVTTSAPTEVSSPIALPSFAAAAAAVTTLASPSMSVSLPSAAPVVPSNTQSTVLTVTPGTTDPSAQTSATSGVSTTAADTRGTSRRRKAKPHSRGTQPKRVVRKESTVVAPIVLDSSGETHATVPTTASSAAAKSAASSISNLLTSAENEQMRVCAARVARFAYAQSRSPTSPSNPLRISDSPAAAENPAALSSESEGPTRAPTPHLPSEILPLPESASTPGSAAHLVKFADSNSRLCECSRLFCVRKYGQRVNQSRNGS